MNAAKAQSLMAAIHSLALANNAVAAEIEGLSDEQERKRFRRAIANIMADVSIELIDPIVAQHPDLEPDKE